MKVHEKTNISTRELTRLPNNPRKITQHDLNILCDSLRLNGCNNNEKKIMYNLKPRDGGQSL